MTIRRREFIAGSAAAVSLVSAPTVLRAEAPPIRIGEINSYTVLPEFLGPYKKAWTMVQDEVNAAGGVNGRKIETVFRDDAGKPDEAVKQAGQLIGSEKVDFLAGGYLSNVCLAVSSFAKQNKQLYIAAEPLSDALIWAQGHRYCFRLRPSTYSLAAMMAEQAAKLPAKRWAAVNWNFEFGQAVQSRFKELLTRAKPDVQFVAEVFAPFGKLDAGSTVEAVAQSKPDAIFCSVVGADLANFLRQGVLRGIFEGRPVVAVDLAEPEFLDPLKDESPVGWIMSGYPPDLVNTPEHTRFREAYQKRYGEVPHYLGAIVGYDVFNAIVTLLKTAPSTATETLVDTLEGLKFDAVFGPAQFRKIDHQSTIGTYVGTSALKEGKWTLTDWFYASGEKYMPSDEEVRKLRPQTG